MGTGLPMHFYSQPLVAQQLKQLPQTCKLRYKKLYPKQRRGTSYSFLCMCRVAQHQVRSGSERFSNILKERCPSSFSITILTFPELVKPLHRGGKGGWGGKITQRNYYCYFKEKHVSHLCRPLLLGREQIWRFQLERYCSGKVVNDREYKVPSENAISTLNIALLQQHYNEMIKWLLAEERQRIESGRNDIHEKSFLCYSKI